MADRLTRIAIINEDMCKPKKCRQECKKSCPVVKTGKFPLELSDASLAVSAVRSVKVLIWRRWSIGCEIWGIGVA